jgi:hypothetical protein
MARDSNAYDYARDTAARAEMNTNPPAPFLRGGREAGRPASAKIRELILERSRSDRLLESVDRPSVLLRARCTFDPFPSRRGAKRSLYLGHQGARSIFSKAIWGADICSLPPSACRTKQSLFQLVCDFFTKPNSNASLVEKDAERSASSPEHKRAHNQ